MKSLPTKSICFFLLVLLVVGSTPAWAQYPDRPIKMIVPFGSGGAMDITTRVMSSYMEKFLGQPMVIINKPGGGGSLGLSFAARAHADGYTVVAAAAGVLLLLPIVQKVDYKLDDFVLVGTWGCVPVWLAVRSDAKWKTLKDFIDDARKSDAHLSVGSYGRYTGAEFTIHLLNKGAGVNLIHVPFKSSGEALTNVLGKNVNAAVVTGSNGLVASGAVRILAVAAKARLNGLATDVPTFTELGYPIVMPVCYTFALPKGTPKEIVDRLAQAQKKAFERYGKEINQKLQIVDVWESLSTPEETAAEYREQYQAQHKIMEELREVAQ